MPNKTFTGANAFNEFDEWSKSGELLPGSLSEIEVRPDGERSYVRVSYSAARAEEKHEVLPLPKRAANAAYANRGEPYGHERPKKQSYG